MSRWSNSEQAIAACGDRGFTPSNKEVDELLRLLATVDRDAAKDIASALTRADTFSMKAALAAFPSAGPPLRARLVDVLGRIAQKRESPELSSLLETAVLDPDLATARKAIVMLGKQLRARRLPAQIESALLSRFANSPAPLQRAITEILGKAGSKDALKFLKGHEPSDPEQRRLQSRATLMLERSHTRDVESQINLDARLPASLRIALGCRSGLSRLLALEVSAFAKVVRREQDRVLLDHAGDLRSLLQARTALDIALLQPLPKGESVVQRVVEALSNPSLQRALRAWTQGAIRFRVSWLNAGHGRGATWKLAQLVAEHLPDMINDPVQACWDCRVDEHKKEIALVPRAFADPRFTYRMADVPAASHPTLAAALCLQAAPKETDTVWDPFVGSGLELIEVARRAKVRGLFGTDTDAKALEAAAANIRAAKIDRVELRLADARSYRAAPVSLIITNPPMGRRVARDGALLDLLDDFLRNARDNLLRGGRLVWLSPAAAHTARAAQRLGFRVEQLEAVDVGGFDAELQVLRAPG